MSFFFLSPFYERLKFREGTCLTWCQIGRGGSAEASAQLCQPPQGLPGASFFPHTPLLLPSPLWFPWKFNYDNLVGVPFLVKMTIRKPQLSRRRSSKANCAMKGFPSHQPLLFLFPAQSCCQMFGPQEATAKHMVIVPNPVPTGIILCSRVHLVDGFSRAENLPDGQNFNSCDY